MHATNADPLLYIDETTRRCPPWSTAALTRFFGSGSFISGSSRQQNPTGPGAVPFESKRPNLPVGNHRLYQYNGPVLDGLETLERVFGNSRMHRRLGFCHWPPRSQGILLSPVYRAEGGRVGRLIWSRTIAKADFHPQSSPPAFQGFAVKPRACAKARNFRGETRPMGVCDAERPISHSSPSKEKRKPAMVVYIGRSSPLKLEMRFSFLCVEVNHHRVRQTSPAGSSRSWLASMPNLEAPRILPSAAPDQLRWGGSPPGAGHRRRLHSQ